MNRGTVDQVVPRPVRVRRVRPLPWRAPATGAGDGPLARPWIPAAALAAGLVGAVLWFLSAATPVTLDTVPREARVELDTWLQLPIGRRILLLPGVHRLHASAPGHYDRSFDVTVRPGVDAQVVPVQLERTPGRVTLALEPPEASERGPVRVQVDAGEARVLNGPFELPAGRRELVVRVPRYEAARLRVDVEGMGREQTVTVPLVPAFGYLSVETTPAGARIFAGDTPVGRAPGPVEVDAGRLAVTVQADGYEPWRDTVEVPAGGTVALPPVTLEPAAGQVAVTSSPDGANVTLDDRFVGRTPLTVAVPPGRPFALEVYRSGYQVARRTLTVPSGRTLDLDLTLEPRLGEVVVAASPEDAEILVDGRIVGRGRETLRLPARPHDLEIRRDGYAPYATQVVPRPELPLAVRVDLLTLEEARWAALPVWTEAPDGTRMRLFRTGSLHLGAPRRQPGRRRNEVERDVELTRAFYLGAHEVTNAQFAAFRPRHRSGRFQNRELDGDDLPVVNVSWTDAALYCNWLSEREGLDPVYRIEGDAVTGFDAGALGYRLPTEAEWAWAARRDAEGRPLVFPWGTTAAPPRRAGNFADRSAAYMLPDTLRDYGDGYVATAPVGSFPADPRGLYDLAGNVAEWVNDFYGEDPEQLGGTDPLGPPGGKYHVIRGSSWQHGTIVELRTTFRDYGTEGRPDVGFRIARYAEPAP